MSTLPELSLHNQAQPLPKRVAAAVANFSLNPSNPPKVEVIASARGPVGAPPAPAAMFCQKIEWFRCPPPLFLTAPRMLSGSAVTSARTSSMLLL